MAPLCDALTLGVFLPQNKWGVMENVFPGRIPSAELLVSSDMPAGPQGYPGWAEQPHAKGVVSPEPPAWDTTGEWLPLPHLPFTCLKPNFLIFIQNVFA